MFGLVGLLHGDMTQGNRDDVIAAFKQKKFPILIATDVAGAVSYTKHHHLIIITSSLQLGDWTFH